jgi:hypothetical protein
MIKNKSDRPISVTLKRAQSRALLVAAARMLRDPVTCPNGPDRRALECAVRAIQQARDSDEAQHAT